MLKRPKIISPEILSEIENQIMRAYKVGYISHSGLMADIRPLLDTKLATLAKNYNLVELSNDNKTLKVENENLKEEIDFIKRQQICFVDKLNDLEGRSRINNLIFRGLSFSKGNEYKKNL